MLLNKPSPKHNPLPKPWFLLPPQLMPSLPRRVTPPLPGRLFLLGLRSA